MNLDALLLEKVSIEEKSAPVYKRLEEVQEQIEYLEELWDNKLEEFRKINHDKICKILSYDWVFLLEKKVHSVFSTSSRDIKTILENNYLLEIKDSNIIIQLNCWVNDYDREWVDSLSIPFIVFESSTLDEEFNTWKIKREEVQRSKDLDTIEVLKLKLGIK